MANDVRQALIESGDGTIPLRWSTRRVQLPMVDADAIINQPMAFRAGAIGPDVVVFAGMTDGTHAVDQEPYRQCQMLYDEAFTEAERAYALGCFLHGATDAIAHHFVNYVTGETFTLTPLTSDRGPGYHNVVGHIVTESIIQNAFYTADPSAFSQSELDHRIEQDFVLRVYFDSDSAVWQRMAQHPMERWRAAQAADPDGNLVGWARSAGFSPWEQVAMAPQYIEELQRMRAALRRRMVDRIAELASAPSIMARPGPDGVVGTLDDETACRADCPAEFGEYWILVHLLAPRYDTRGNPLPSAFDKISEDLGSNLYGFLRAFVQVIQNVSNLLNSGIDDTGDHGFDLHPSRIREVFAPVDEWAGRTFAIDWTTAGMAVSPAWYNDLSAFLSMFRVRVTIADVLRALFEPIVQEIRVALITEVRERAAVYVDDLKRAYDAALAPWTERVYDVLDSSAPPALGGNALDHLESSGLFVHSFNLTVATLANHELVLVTGDPIAHGPASFDASYTPEWTQVGLCDYLRDAVFPHGLGMRPLLSVERGATFYGAVMPEDSPIECHDGSLSTFGPPNAESCAHTSIDALREDPYGSLTRAYPPANASGTPGCRGLVVPGLPEPPPMPETPDAATSADVDGGPAPAAASAGCACAVAPGADDGRNGAGAGALVLLLLGLTARRRRARLSRTVRAVTTAVVLAGCGEPVNVDGSDSGTPRDDGATDSSVALEPDSGAVPVDAGPDHRPAFLASLDGTVWSALQTRDENGREVERAYELHFRGGSEPMWGEIRNPYGPARQRIRRFVRVARDGCESASQCEISTTVSIPDASWETPESLRGATETWTIEILDGSPRALAITNQDGVEEVFTEGAWPAPTSGLTAEVRVFEGGAGKPVSDAFCTSGAIFSGDIGRSTIWSFARGESDQPTLGYELAAGVRLGEWNDNANRFGVRDIDGFQIDDLGGSIRTDQFFFVVRYRGIVSHPGGRFQLREEDDTVEDAVWAFIGDDVGGTTIDDLFLEVHHFAPPDETVDEPSLDLAAGDLPIEIIIPRCEMNFTGSGQVRVEPRLGTAPYRLLSEQPIRPVIDASLFPPVL
nr:Hypothetical protein MSR10575_88590 [Sandaracinus sp.]